MILKQNNAITFTATLLFVSSTTAFTYLVVKYGFQGAVRLIWEGDNLPKEVRIQLSHLESILHITIPNIHSRAIQIQKGSLSIMNPKEIYMISQELDKIASQIDNVQSSIDGHFWSEIKVLKKKCSDEVVQVMRFVDTILNSM